LLDLKIICSHVYLRCEIEKLWQRIQNRLEREPLRLTYPENNKYFLCELYTSYENKISMWDYTIYTTALDPHRVAHQVINIVNDD
jgi:deoxyadenosine/deoxycytidine kinase